MEVEDGGRARSQESYYLTELRLLLSPGMTFPWARITVSVHKCVLNAQGTVT